MYKIIKVGIPIRECDISDDFINCVNEIKTDPSCIGISLVSYSGDIINNGEYNCAPAGHNYIFSQLPMVKYYNTFHPKCITCLEHFWDISDFNGMYRNGDFLTDILILTLNKYYKETGFKKVFIFSQGSPLYADGITDSLSDKVDLGIIDTRSSLEICEEIFNKLLKDDGLKHINVITGDYWKDFLYNNETTINNGTLTIFPAINNVYNVNIKMPLVEHFFINMKRVLDKNDIIISVHIGVSGNTVKKFAVSDYHNHLHEYTTTSKPHIFAVLKF